MTDLTLRITEDIKTAMRAGDKARLSVLRMLSAELKQREVVESITLTDAVVIAAIEKMIKQRRDSEQQYRAGDRAELADKEAAEIIVLQHYLPQPLSDSEITALIEEAVSATGAESGRDMGKVIGWLKPKVAGRADMGALSGRIKQRLS
jgi:uncharacterized protein